MASLTQHTRLILLCIALLLPASLYTQAAYSQVAVEPLGVVETLPDTPGATWFWASDPLLERVALTDFSSNRVLGSVDGGWGITAILFAQQNRHEFYVPETHYSRGSRGERTDVVTFYDSKTLAPIDEVIIPAKRAHNALPTANATLTDDENFVVIFNMTPAQSISIVDTQQRRFVTEIPTPGCSLVYGAGERRVMMFCGDGSLLFITLNNDGTLQHKQRSAVFFDPQQDPLTEKGVRIGTHWYFVSFEGYVYAVDTSAQAGSFATPWSLISDEERRDSWRVGGRQFFAIHPDTMTGYVLMHEGEIDTHKTGGTHLWTFDLNTQQKIAAHKLVSPGFTFSGVPTEFGADWIWPFNGLYSWLAGFSFIEPHARPDAIIVTAGPEPVLLLGGQFSGMVAVYDALTMEFQHRITTGNLSNLVLQYPPVTSPVIPASPSEQMAAQ